MERSYEQVLRMSQTPDDTRMYYCGNLNHSVGCQCSIGNPVGIRALTEHNEVLKAELARYRHGITLTGVVYKDESAEGKSFIMDLDLPDKFEDGERVWLTVLYGSP